ncbi:hypothetical protein ONZ43_g1519 [Nemania bipapillata]|uniref:Uncharacterized protein n=1 Tax=Nemania bipapillata TaxID=110536 RepID=A0ACC2J496_9PEZI|nr:hypothetical protein ONZ43_g1519 [Nemania bipapillata]
MSPVAYSGTPVTANSAMTSNAYNHTTASARNEPAGGNTYNGGPGARKEPFRHIDDIVSVTVDLDPHATLRKVLEAGDSHMQQAVTYKTFGRPDFALQEYIKAFTIAVDKVPKHKDYPSLKSDRGDLNRQYNALKVKITNNGVAYDKVKELIKEDNLRSGVRPKKEVNKSPANQLLDMPNVPSSPPLRQSIDSHDSSSLGRKSRPIVHPKPQSLHGNAIKPVSNKASPDLVARKTNWPQGHAFYPPAPSISSQLTACHA